MGWNSKRAQRRLPLHRRQANSDPQRRSNDGGSGTRQLAGLVRAAHGGQNPPPLPPACTEGENWALLPTPLTLFLPFVLWHLGCMYRSLRGTRMGRFHPNRGWAGGGGVSISSSWTQKRRHPCRSAGGPIVLSHHLSFNVKSGTATWEHDTGHAYGLLPREAGYNGEICSMLQMTHLCLFSFLQNATWLCLLCNSQPLHGYISTCLWLTELILWGKICVIGFYGVLVVIRELYGACCCNSLYSQRWQSLDDGATLFKFEMRPPYLLNSYQP
jgi:hypothetical protein